MLKLENLGDRSFDDMVDSAVKGIARFDTEWNNLQASDPGMTLVDLLAWLKAVQHEYMSVIVPESRRRFLNLLDIHQRRGRGSETLIAVSGAKEDMEIPSETRWTAGDMVFENPEPAAVHAAVLRAVSFRRGDMVETVAAEELDGGRSLQVFPGLGQEPERAPDTDMTLWFSRPLPAGRDIGLYFSVRSDVSRNPAPAGADMAPMARIAWEVLTAEGWRDAQVCRDGTWGFLFSGVVRLRHDGIMAEGERGFAVRARLLEDGYDLPPRIDGICVNVLEVRQQETLVRCDRAAAGGGALLRSRLAAEGRHRVFLACGGGWRETHDFEVIPGPSGTRVILPGEPGEALVISCDGRFADALTLGSGTGFSNQELPFECGNILYDSFQLMVGRRGEDGVLFTRWEKRDDLLSSGPRDRHYVLDTEKGRIRFGDHERGTMPPKGEGNILLSGLATCLGKASNIKSGRIDRAGSRDPALAALAVRQLTPAVGGEDPETFEEAAARAAETLRSGEKLVTEADYLAAVRAAPGLAVENCRVLTGFEGDGDARVTVVVQGAGRARSPLGAYEQGIRRALERRRLLGVRVNVVWPETVRLAVRGRIVTALYYPDAARRVRSRIEGFVEKLNERFGSPLNYGELYCAVDMLECVSSIVSLSVEPVGSAVTRTGTDDLIVPSNGVYRIERFELSFVGDL